MMLIVGAHLVQIVFDVGVGLGTTGRIGDDDSSCENIAPKNLSQYGRANNLEEISSIQHKQVTVAPFRLFFSLAPLGRLTHVIVS